MSTMMIVVPTRSRPHNIAPVVQSWHDTRAFAEGAELVFVIDDDDPKHGAYREALDDVGAGPVPGKTAVAWIAAGAWLPLVPKLNNAANYLRVTQRPFALGFAGDDHRPRTTGWAAGYLSDLGEMGTGIVSCPDGARTDDLPTQWAMTSDIIEALGGRMVPAPVEHLYCDDAIRELGKAAECYRWRADLLIDHLNPYVGARAPLDEQYERVNSAEQYKADRPSYRRWKRYGGLIDDATAVRNLRTPKGQS